MGIGEGLSADSASLQCLYYNYAVMKWKGHSKMLS